MGGIWPYVGVGGFSISLPVGVPGMEDCCNLLTGFFLTYLLESLSTIFGLLPYTESSTGTFLSKSFMNY